MEPLDQTIGFFTTDKDLVVRSWDAPLENITGIPREETLGKALPDLVPDLKARGLLNRFRNVLNQGVVEVLSPAFHQYLFARPAVVPSRHFDQMQQRVTITPVKDGQRITGTLVSIEDVTDRRDRERDAAADLSGPDELKRMQAARVLGRDEDGSDILLDALSDDSWRVRREAVDGLIRHGGPEAIRTLLKTLIGEHRDFSVLSSAIEILSLSRIDVLGPLTELLEESDEDLKIQVAQILGERGDARAVSGLMAALKDPDANVKYHVIEALGKLRAWDAIDALMAVVESRDFFLAFPALDALMRIGDASVVPHLIPLLKDDLLRNPTAELLGKLGDHAAIPPLVDLLNEPGVPAPAVAEALSALFVRYETLFDEGGHVIDLVRKQIRAPGIQNLLDAIASAQEVSLRPLAIVLGWMEGQAVERALSRLLGNPEVRKEVVEALIRHGRRVTGLLIEQLAAEDLEVRQAAVMALGRIGDPGAVSALIEVLQGEPDLAILAAGALAKIGDLGPFEALISMLGHPEVAVRQAIISALNSMGHPDMPDRIRSLLEDPDPKVRESAVKIAGYFSYPQCIDPLLERTRDPVEDIRRAAVEHLPYVDDERAFSCLVHALSNDSPKVRAAAAKALAHAEATETVPRLLEALADPDPWVRFYAARSIGRHRSVEASERLSDLITRDPAHYVRIEAMNAIAKIDGKDTVPLLEPFVTDPDLDMARAAIRALGDIDRPEARPLLLEALRSDDSERRIAAVHALGESRGAEVAEMLQWVAATDPDEKVVGIAMQVLGRLSSSEAIGVLVNLTADAGLRPAAVSALKEIQACDIAVLAKSLSHPQASVKRAVVEVLARIKRPEASEYLLKALKDPDPRVRLDTVKALDNLGNRQARESLLQVAHADPDLAVRRAARSALSKL